nr:TolC family protein [Acinetobacter lactucae]
MKFLFPVSTRFGTILLFYVFTLPQNASAGPLQAKQLSGLFPEADLQLNPLNIQPKIQPDNSVINTFPEQMLKVDYRANTPMAEHRNQPNYQNCLSHAALKQGQTLELIQAVEKAVCHNPETHNAWIQMRIQAARLGMSRSAYYPQVNTTLYYNWGKDHYQVTDRRDLSYDTDTRRYGASIQANWLIYDFGVRKYQYSEAENLLTMSLAQQDNVLQSIILKTISAYYAVLQQELKLDNLQQVVLLAVRNHDIALARYKAGVGIKSDELQMAANLAKAKSDQTKLLGDLKIAKGQLSILMGEPAYQDFNLNSQLKIPMTLDLKPIDALIKQAIEMHPRFKAARFAIEAAKDKVQSVKKSRYPALSFMSSYNNSEQIGESPFANNTQQIQAGIQLTVPLFDGFNRKHQIDEAKQTLHLKQVEEEQLKQEIPMEIWRIYNKLQATHENIKALSTLNDSAEQAYEVYKGDIKQVLVTYWKSLTRRIC